MIFSDFGAIKGTVLKPQTKFARIIRSRGVSGSLCLSVHIVHSSIGSSAGFRQRRTSEDTMADRCLQHAGVPTVVVRHPGIFTLSAAKLRSA